MTRVRNLGLFGTIALILLIGLTWTFRGQLGTLLGPLIGVNVDSGAGGRAELQLPDGHAALGR